MISIVLNNMGDYKKRVIREKDELDMKRYLLQAFVKTKAFDGLPDKEKILLSRQLESMAVYSDILNERILGF